MSEDPHLLTEESGTVFIATLNRPEKLNALSGAMMSLLEAAVYHPGQGPLLLGWRGHAQR
jgi:enoyl-CoA hydratase